MNYILCDEVHASVVAGARVAAISRHVLRFYNKLSDAKNSLDNFSSELLGRPLTFWFGSIVFLKSHGPREPRSPHSHNNASLSVTIVIEHQGTHYSFLFPLKMYANFLWRYQETIV